MTGQHGSEREAVIARLRARLGDRFTEDNIAQAVHAAFDDLAARATFQAYLPVLAERSATARLTVGAHQDSATVELRDATEASTLGLEGNPQTPPRAFSRPQGTLDA